MSSYIIQVYNDIMVRYVSVKRVDVIPEAK